MCQLVHAFRELYDRLWTQHATLPYTQINIDHFISKVHKYLIVLKNFIIVVPSAVLFHEDLENKTLNGYFDFF